jgi:putative addiction module component (TIGR02574 family)
MSKSEILAELPKLQPDELAEVQAKLDELIGEVWLDNVELTDTDKTVLDSALVEYQKDPDSGSSWEDVKARIQAKICQ